MSTWAIEVGGIKRSLLAWGVIEAKLTLLNQATDTLVLVTGPESQWEFGTEVVLWFGTTRRFRGIVTDNSYSERAADVRRSYEISGPWWYLENIVYQQTRHVLIDAMDIGKGYTTVETSASVLFINSDAGGSLAAGVQAKRAIDYAIAKGAPIARTTNFDLDSAEVPWETGNDLPCGDVVRRCARWSRNAVAWWDYSSAVPVLHFGRRPNLAPVTIDLAAGDKTAEVQVAPCHELQPRGVLINFLKTEVNDAGEEWLKIEKRTAGVADGGPRCVVITFQLAGKGKASEPIPSGLASLFWDSVRDLQWKGSLQYREAGISGAIGVGRVLNLTSGDAAWSTMNALIQQVEEDLLTGEVRIEYGPPTQLGIQDFVELIATRSGTNSGSGGGSNVGGNGNSILDGQPADGGRRGGGGGGGGGGVPSGPPTQNGNGTIPMEVCVGGERKKVNLVGAFG